MRELVWMAQGKSEQEWDHTAMLCSLLANINRGPKTKEFRLEDFHPYIASKKSHVIDDSKTGFEQLKRLFVKPENDLTAKKET